jgi:hypothetical protein
MSLKTATVIALIGVLLHGLLVLLPAFDAISFSTRDSYKLYSVVSLVGKQRNTRAISWCSLVQAENSRRINGEVTCPKT